MRGRERRLIRDYEIGLCDIFTLLHAYNDSSSYKLKSKLKFIQEHKRDLIYTEVRSRCADHVLKQGHEMRKIYNKS